MTSSGPFRGVARIFQGLIKRGILDIQGVRDFMFCLYIMVQIIRKIADLVCYGHPTPSDPLPTPRIVNIY